VYREEHAFQAGKSMPNEPDSGQNIAQLKKRIYHFACELLRGDMSP
jgi:hypothetical protein